MGSFGFDGRERLPASPMPSRLLRRAGKTTVRQVSGQASAVLCQRCLGKHRWSNFFAEGLIGTVFGIGMLIGGLYGYNWLTFDHGAEGLIGLGLKFIAICVMGGGLITVVDSVKSFFGWLFAGPDKTGPSLAIAVRRKELEAAGSNGFWATRPQGTSLPG